MGIKCCDKSHNLATLEHDEMKFCSRPGRAVSTPILNLFVRSGTGSQGASPLKKVRKNLRKNIEAPVACISELLKLILDISKGKGAL